MKKVLYVTANPKQEKDSYSLQAGRKFIEAYREKNPSHNVTEIDVFEANIPLVDRDILNAWGKLQSGKSFTDLNEVEAEKVSRFGKFTDQFLEADKYIFVTPLWNFTVPALMKAYIDTTCVAGKTFQYTQNGPVGLLKDKKALHIQASGGVYSHGPAAGFEHGSNYLQGVCQFLGVDNFERVLLEGTALDPQNAENVKQEAIQTLESLAQTF